MCPIARDDGSDPPRTENPSRVTPSGTWYKTGGDGADTFFFILQEDSPAGFLTRDVVQDFSRSQGDGFDLSFIDADAESSGNGTFEFLGKDALIDAPGQITYSFEGNNTVVKINTVGGFNSPPEMEIQLAGAR